MFNKRKIQGASAVSNMVVTPFGVIVREKCYLN